MASGHYTSSRVHTPLSQDAPTPDAPLTPPCEHVGPSILRYASFAQTPHNPL
jgi:hypothetical protein